MTYNNQNSLRSLYNEIDYFSFNRNDYRIIDLHSISDSVKPLDKLFVNPNTCGNIANKVHQIDESLSKKQIHKIDNNIMLILISCCPGPCSPNDPSNGIPHFFKFFKILFLKAY